MRIRAKGSSPVGITADGAGWGTSVEQCLQSEERGGTYNGRCTKAPGTSELGSRESVVNLNGMKTTAVSNV